MPHVRLSSALKSAGPLIYCQSVWTRVTHWRWAICLFFCCSRSCRSSTPIPTLYVGQGSGFGYDNAVLRMYAVDTPDGPQGRTSMLAIT